MPKKAIDFKPVVDTVITAINKFQNPKYPGKLATTFPIKFENGVEKAVGMNLNQLVEAAFPQIIQSMPDTFSYTGKNGAVSVDGHKARMANFWAKVVENSSGKLKTQPVMGTVQICLVTEGKQAAAKAVAPALTKEAALQMLRG